MSSLAQSASPASAGASVFGKALSVRKEAAQRGMSKSAVSRERAAAKARAMAEELAALRGQLAASQSRAAAAPVAASVATAAEKPRVRVKAGSAPIAAEAPAPKVGKPIAGGTLVPPEARERRARGRRFVLVGAQNNTWAHRDFIESLRVYCDLNGSRLMVSGLPYNRDGWEQPHRLTKEDDSLWYDPLVEPFMSDETLWLADSLLWCGKVATPITAADPLSGMESFTRDASGIFPHTKVAMKSLAGMKSHGARFIYTTGCCTQRNYIQRKVGQKAEFHHVFGALAVEVASDGAWFARQLIADEGGRFQDLETVYTPHGARRANVAGIVWGDIHRKHLEGGMFRACWGDGGILDTLHPRWQVAHDVLHFTGPSHHSLKDPFLQAQYYRDGSNSVEHELDGDADFFLGIERPWCETIVPDANHHCHLRRWLTEADFRKDPANARIGHYLAWRIHEAIERGENINIYEVAVREAAERKRKGALKRTRWLLPDESFEVAGVECGLHGDLGPNGARGSPKSFRQLGRRAVTGHTHSAGIVDGVWTVGVTGSLDQGYNKGPSSWSHTHCVIFENGKRQLITMQGDRWRAD
ncbi:conserved protein of unknown function (plasmid) [Rhodovastum atsumiense]|uniref:Uncharacterized protein n=1 Tax=Rhodovastum atsumiense TaxID=504468 RepID=A0A5M6IUE4_9PROT|nr:hypothetical protein [Rhodovastum atsumiense]KAA5611892.1 hypothetical protein F1189_12735 [Rhodovastum atsumiense]CAH2606129.1 conserved protein of unknown function [Rhodovastum atsumiense]